MSAPPSSIDLTAARPRLPEVRATPPDAESLLAVLDALPLGVLLVDESGRIAACNREARRLLDAGDGLAEVRGHLVGRTCRHTAALREIVCQALAGEPRGGHRSLSLGRGACRRSLEVVATGTRRAGLAVLYVIDPEGDTGPDAEALRALYGLTAAEAAFAAELARGRTLDQIADGLGVSRHTVRGHLKAVFAKTGTHRQAELVGLLLRSAARIGSLG